MDKKIVYIGLGLIVIAIVLFLINIYLGSSVSSGFQNVLLTQNLTINGGAFSSVSINATNNSYFFVAAQLSKEANIYLFNSSAYKSWKSAVSSNSPVHGITAAIGLEGKGAFYIFKNTINASIPQGLGISAQNATYATNSTALYPAGTYYVVIDNTNGSASYQSQVLAHVLYLPPITNSSITSGPLAGLGGQITQEIWLGLAFFIILVAGLVVTVYGYFKKPKFATTAATPFGKPATPGSEVDTQYVDKLYKNVDQRKKAKKKST